MKVFVFPGTYPDSRNPSAGIFVKEQCDLLKKTGHDVIVLDASACSYRHWMDDDCKAPCKLTSGFGEGYVWHRRGLMDLRLPRYAVASYNACARKLYRLAVQEYGRPDIIIAHFGFPAGFATRDIAVSDNVPFIVVEHFSIYLQAKLNQYINMQLRRTLYDAASYICVSDSLKESIERHTGIRSKITVIPNVINPMFSYCPPPKDKPFQFFCAGGTRRSKRSDLLIDAFAKAFLPQENVVLVIAGPGDNWASLENHVKSHKRCHQIHLAGRLDRAQMFEQYRSCHCYAMPSEYETFGIVYREAMAVGRPVISTRNGGIDDNWNDTFGILIHNNDISTLASAMRHMYTNYSEYNGVEISRLCLSQYGADIVTSKMERIILDAMTMGART